MQGKMISRFTLFMALIAACCNLYPQEYINSSAKPVTKLESGFLTPPLFAKPRVYWWWLHSMATKESITRDLEELKAKGFGGVLVYDAGSSNYEVALRTKPGPLFGSKEWRELFVFALQEANRLGLEVSLNVVSGWNPGGPTVEPQDALKKVVWSEQIIEGNSLLTKLPVQPKGELYKDIAIQAIKINGGKKKSYLMNWELKSLNERFKGFDEYPFYKFREEDESLINDYDAKKDSVIELTEMTDSVGNINWRVPEGTWKIIRIGSALTGVRVSTPSHGYDGLSYDHLSAKAFNKFFKQAVDPLLDDARPYIGKTLKYLMTDSWEMDMPNWTDEFKEEFIKRRGYNPEKYLSIITGEVIENREISNRFLYDFRKTVGDCIADNTYLEFEKAAHERGLSVHPESGGPHAAPIDGLKCFGRNDLPMGEFWARSNTHRVTEDQRMFIKQSSSAAHIYGKRFVAGEGPTSIGPQWERSPKDLKSVFDRIFCEGLNRIFWHCFTSSPKEFGLPGNEYFAGTHLNPNVTWWNQSGDFINYLSRISFMLSQGLYNADILSYYGDDVTVLANRKKIKPGMCFGYDYDDCNAEVILERLSVKDGKLALPDGMTYNVLLLPERTDITLEVLKKIEKLVNEGAIVCGPKPAKATGLSGYPESDKEVKLIADKLWGDCDGKNIVENSCGKGKVFWGKPIKDILAEMNVPPDFGFTSNQDSAQIDYIHRKTDSADIYFVVNYLARKGIYDSRYRYIPDTLPDRYEQINCKFRVSGKTPEIWNPMTGNIEDAPLYYEENGYTVVPMLFEPEGSRFVIFRKPSLNAHIVALKQEGKQILPGSGFKAAMFEPVSMNTGNGKYTAEVFRNGKYEFDFSNGSKKNINVKNVTAQLFVEGAWEVRFSGVRGAPDKTVFNKLVSWTENDNPNIKYFSGTGVYVKEFTLTKEQLRSAKVYIDLGNVQELAGIEINGVNLGTSWMPPFMTDITKAVKPGKNIMKVSVTNLWPNRLIGDQLLPENERFTKTNVIKFKKDDQLRLSGLLGPVRIIFSKLVPINN